MSTTFVNAQVVDGLGRSFSSGHLVIDDGRINSVGPGLPPDVDPSSHKDLKGKTILPGLIDCHVHLRNDGVADPRAQSVADTDAVAVLRSARNALKSLEGGITTVRDCGSRGFIDFSLRKAAEEGPLQDAASCIQRHDDLHDRRSWLALAMEADGQDGLRRAARAQIKAGADNVKLIASGGILTPGTEIGAAQFTVEEMRAAVDEAHAAGKTSCAHAHGTQAIKNATRAGVDSIEHGYLIDDEGIELMIERGTYLVATSAAVRNVVRHGVSAGIRPDVVRKAKSAIERHIDGFKRAHKAGVKLAMGTDSGVPFTDHGNNLDELVYLVEMGLTPMEAISVSTHPRRQSA